MQPRAKDEASAPVKTVADLPFNRPYATGREFEYIAEAIDNGYLAGNGPFGERCAQWLQQRTGSRARC